MSAPTFPARKGSTWLPGESGQRQRRRIPRRTGRRLLADLAVFVFHLFVTLFALYFLLRDLAPSCAPFDGRSHSMSLGASA